MQATPQTASPTLRYQIRTTQAFQNTTHATRDEARARKRELKARGIYTQIIDTKTNAAIR